MKLVKQQVNGHERVVLKENATREDLPIEAAKLQERFGYEVKPDGRGDRLLASHPFYRGRYVIALEPD